MESPPASPKLGRATQLGFLAAAAIALVYGVLQEIGLSWGLIIVGLIGGWLIGTAVVQGAFDRKFHLVVPRVRWLAALITVAAWVGANIVGYVAGQIFYQLATTPLGDRVSIGGFLEYLNSSVISPSILGLAAMAIAAWRSAR